MAAITTAPQLSLPSILPPQVAFQIRAAQQKAALNGQAPGAWAIGARCQALYSGDGEQHEGTVTGVTAYGNFVVQFSKFDHEEEVHLEAHSVLHYFALSRQLGLSYATPINTGASTTLLAAYRLGLC